MGYWAYVSYKHADFEKKIEYNKKIFDSFVSTGNIASYIMLNDENGVIFEVITWDAYNLK
jgi:hypothetical protein